MKKNGCFGALYKFELLKILKNKVAVIAFLIFFIFGFVQGEFEVRGNIDPDTLKEHMTLDGRILESSGDVLAEVSGGTALAGIALEEAALRKIAEGANIALAYPAEGTSAVPDGTAIVRGTSREEAAKRFVDFTVDRDVQERLPERFWRRPVTTRG